MHNKRVWQVLDSQLLLDLSLLVASVALVAFDNFTLDHALERVVEGLLPAHVQSQAIEVLLILVDVTARPTDSQRRSLALEDVLHEVLLRSILQGVFKLVKCHVDELLGVHLHSHVGWSTAWLLVGEAEVFRVVLLTVGHAQEGEHSHPLVQVIVDNLSAFVLHAFLIGTIISCEQRVAESRHVEHLLNH